MKISLTALISFLLICFSAQSQRIVYSEPDKDDARSVNFEIIGKLNGLFHIYKGNREHSITLYNNDMKVAKRHELDFLPDRVLNVDFINYNSFYYMLYQYQKRNIVHLAAAKFDGDGKLIGEPFQLDTTQVNFNASNKLYTIINSENKQNIAAFKVNSRDEKAHVVITVLFDEALKLKRKSRLTIDMPDRHDMLSEFNIDNDGNIVFLKTSGTSGGDNITKLNLIRQKPATDDYTVDTLNISKIYLDDIKLKVNNATGQYVITSFYSKSRRGNIDGLYVSVWDKGSSKEKVFTSLFNDELRSEARGESGLKNAFNDYYIQNIYLRKDGGFLVASEAMYSASRGSNLNRWDYFNSPYMGMSDYYMWRNYGGFYSPWNRGYGYNITRYYADNILLLSYSAKGEVEWTSVVRKSQYDDNTDNLLSYSTVNTGDAIHFLFNLPERKMLLLTDHTVEQDGQIKRNPTFKNLDRGYDFMPRFGKQVSARQTIIPCMYRNYICFAKLEF